MDTLSMRDHTIRHGGGTWSADGQLLQPLRGYAVAMHPGTFERVAADDVRGFASAVERATATFKGASIGTWIDDGIVHVDPVVIVSRRSDALRMAQAYGQLAVYSFKDAAEVRAA